MNEPESNDVPLSSRPLPKGIIRSRSVEDAPSPLAPLPPRASGYPAGERGSRKNVARDEREANSSIPLSPKRQKRTRVEEATQGRITAIEPQARHKDRVNIFINGKFAIGLFEDVVVALGLKVGQEVTPERLTELAAAELRRKAREDAYRLLSFRARTEKEIIDRLKRKEYEEDVITETVQYLHEQHLLDDADFAARWTHSKSRTHGERAITMELRQKGVAAETIQEIVSETLDDETQRDAARTLAIKRVGERPVDTSPAAKSKLWAFLARRGFDSDTIRPVLNKLYGASALDSGDE